MALTAGDIAAVVAEIAPVLAGGRIQKIHQPATLTVVLEVRTPGQSHRLLISCFSQSTRLHLTTATMQNPPTPPPFCQFLRAHIQGGRIEAVRQLQNDRIVRIDVTTKRGPQALVAELTGKTASLFVLDSHDGIVKDLKGLREKHGQSYCPPSSVRPARHSSISGTFSISGSLFPISAAIEATYQDKDAAASLEAARGAKIAGLKKAIKKLQRRITAWEDDRGKAAKYRDYGRYGELLKANLRLIRKGQRELALVDYFEESMPTLTIPLDTTKTPQGNMDDYFRKHRKYLSSERELPPRIQAAQVEVSALLAELDAANHADWRPSVQRMERPASRERPKPRPQARQGPFRRFTSADGHVIFIGRNARENEALTFELAKSEDLWLHARGTPGSHVVVRLAKGEDVPPETLRDAATLALLYSDLKNSGKGEVIYTKRKWVKKTKGQALGAVIVTQEKSILVTLDRARLEALKSRSV
ncbi:MAG TPA: NFACT family protein [Nitrospiraceae bacterium]